MNLHNLNLSDCEIMEVLKMKEHFEKTIYLHIYVLYEEVEFISKLDSTWKVGIIVNLNGNGTYNIKFGDII